MEDKARELAPVLVDMLAKKPASSRLLVGIYGIPASGKSTFADLLLKYIDILLVNDPQNSAILVSLDGWHLSRAQLAQFPDPILARDRRGAHWTFDSASYLQFVQSLRTEISADMQIIKAPSWDHSLKDPTPDAISIHPNHRLVIIEGLYAALGVDSWGEAALLLDERWYIELSVEEAQRRLVKRHVITGVGKDLADALWRAEKNDFPNGQFLITNAVTPTRVISSVEDPVLTVEADIALSEAIHAQSKNV